MWSAASPAAVIALTSPPNSIATLAASKVVRSSSLSLLAATSTGERYRSRRSPTPEPKPAPAAMAAMSGVVPSGIANRGLAPPAVNTRIISTSPYLAASQNGVASISAAFSA